VVLTVFKTGGWHLAVSSMGSTPIRFRHVFIHADYVGEENLVGAFGLALIMVSP